MFRQFLHVVFGPHTFEIVAVALIALGVAFALAAERNDIVKAHYFFAAAALLSLGRIVHLLLTWKAESLGARYLIAFLLFGAVAVGWLAAYDWAQNKLNRVTPVPVPAGPITKSDGFTILIPINTANQNMPIPPDENPKDPHSRFYRDLLFSIADRPDETSVGYLMQQRDQLFSEEDRPKFLARLIQMYIFESIFSMTRESYGVELSGGKVTPIQDKAVIPPDVVSSSTEYLIADLSNRRLLTRRIELLLKNFPLHMPRETTVSFIERVDQKSDKPFVYMIRMERTGFFKFDLTVQPMGNSNEGVLPDKFQTQEAKTVKTYSLIIAMDSVIQVKNKDGFEPDKYVAWAQDTFSELRRRMSF